MINRLKKIKGLALDPPGGFTLIETLIAVLVLMMAIAGPLTLAAKGLQATLIAKDQDTAFYLAQDAVEYVRWVRDTNKLQVPPKSWLTGLDGTANGHTNSSGLGGLCTSANGTQSCLVDSLKDTTTSCNAATCSTAINYDTSNNYFNYVSGSASIFARTVNIKTPVCDSGGTICNSSEASVTVVVTWNDPMSHSITVREDIFDWQ